VKIGVNLPNFGSTAGREPITDIARRAEEAGFDSVWVSDHVVMPPEVRSRYPFSPDGSFPWPPHEPWYEPVVAMSFAAAATSGVEIGVGVLIAPLRQPVMLAKQIASLDAYSGGRVILGVGAGWLAEEFDALDVPFAERTRRLEDTVHILRSCWQGRTTGYDGTLTLQPDLWCVPTPARDVPILFGASTEAGLRRAGRLGNGFVGFAHATRLDAGAIEREIGAIRRAAAEHGREEAIARITYRVAGRADEVAAAMPALGQAGVTEIVVTVSWSDRDGPQRTCEALRGAAS
jgi:probable F420-dependent oxidoreductase